MKHDHEMEFATARGTFAAYGTVEIESDPLGLERPTIETKIERVTRVDADGHESESTLAALLEAQPGALEDFEIDCCDQAEEAWQEYRETRSRFMARPQS